ncbi:MAG TPA: hypothetical protein PLP26_11000, partial [Ilumatobacteraceae bacterium]|nr:hypothetical protein [Ilumatobacteraceae bacterium]
MTSCRSISRRAALTAVLLLSLAACGSDKSDATVAASVTTAAPTVPVETPGNSSDGDSIVEQIGGQDAVNALDSVGIGTKAFALSSALGSDREYELVNETTARIFLDGDVDTDSTMACIVVGAIIDEGETVIVVYPNGE